MRRIVWSVLFSIALSGAAAADPATDTSPEEAITPVAAVPANPTPPNVDANVSDETIVCKWTNVIGSRLSDRLCLSKRRWKQMHQDSQDFMRNIDERSDGGQEHHM